jgi:lysophospholipase L1-like esterase
MNRLPLIFISILLTLACKAQKASYDTIPYILDYHNERLALFKKEPMMKGKILFLGNSLTELGDWKKLLKDSTIINRGIAGDITFGVLSRLDEVIALQPARLFLEIGINDIGKTIPDPLIIKNIFTIVERIKEGSPATRIFVQSIFPINDSLMTEYPEIKNKDAHILPINTELSRHAKGMGFTFIDLYSRFVGMGGQLDPRYTADGVHPNAAGYLYWVKILRSRHYL